MYSKLDYAKRGLRFVNNITRPGHKKLSTLMIYGTDLCDSGCKHCLIWAKRPVKHLPFDKIVEVMNSKCVSKHTTVGLEGGEFLLHPETDKILEWFTKNHSKFDLLSNCLKPQNVIDAVKRYPPQRLFVSLDGNNETYKYMRGKDGYNDVIQVIEKCKSLVPISVMFTLSPYNSFKDLDHVIKVCQQHDIDIRVGVYNDIEFFDTVEKAHSTEISSLKNQEKLSYKKVREDVSEILQQKKETLRNLQYQALKIPKHQFNPANGISDFQKMIPESIKETSENFDIILLYDEWRKHNTKLKCYSILDSVVVHPNGDVPICQNLELKLGNVFINTLDEIFNSQSSQKTQKEYVHNCNQCWVSFHRKYDIIMLRTLEKMFPKRIVESIYGKYQWCFDNKLTYKQYMAQYDNSII